MHRDGSPQKFTRSLHKPRSVLRRNDKRQHQLRINPISKLLQLAQPVVEPILIRIPSQVTNVLHEHEGIVEFFVKVRLAVSGVEAQMSLSVDRHRAVNDFKDDARTRLAATRQSVDQSIALVRGRHNPGGEKQFVDKRLVRHRVRVSRLKLRAVQDRKSTRLNSSHLVISYDVVSLKRRKHMFTRPETDT